MNAPYPAEMLEEQFIQRHEAWRAVRKAILSGELVAPDRCGRCGAQGSVQAHHEDYAQPLAVEFLCIPCHRSIHRALRTAISQRLGVGAPYRERTCREDRRAMSRDGAK